MHTHAHPSPTARIRGGTKPGLQYVCCEPEANPSGRAVCRGWRCGLTEALGQQSDQPDSSLRWTEPVKWPPLRVTPLCAHLPDAVTVHAYQTVMQRRCTTFLTVPCLPEANGGRPVPLDEGSHALPHLEVPGLAALLRRWVHHLDRPRDWRRGGRPRRDGAQVAQHQRVHLRRIQVAHDAAARTDPLGTSTA